MPGQALIKHRIHMARIVSRSALFDHQHDPTGTAASDGTSALTMTRLPAAMLNGTLSRRHHTTSLLGENPLRILSKKASKVLQMVLKQIS